MTFDEYQKVAGETAIYPRVGENFIYPSLGLANEAGEVLGEVKRILRDDGEVVTDERRAKILGELGDLLWYAARLASELGVSLQAAAEENVKKLRARKEKGTLRGSGGER